MARRINLDNTTVKLEGRIVYQTMSWGCCRPLFYKVVGLKGKKTVVLEKIPQAYDSKYAGNAPGYLTVPEEVVLNRSPDDIDRKLRRTWYTGFESEHRSMQPVEAYLRKSPIEGGGEFYYLHSLGDNYTGSAGTLFFWDGDAKSGCCD